MSADREDHQVAYTADDMAYARRVGYEMAISLLREDSSAAYRDDDWAAADVLNRTAERLERMKEAILGG